MLLLFLPASALFLFLAIQFGLTTFDLVKEENLKVSEPMKLQPLLWVVTLICDIIKVTKLTRFVRVTEVKVTLSAEISEQFIIIEP